MFHFGMRKTFKLHYGGGSTSLWILFKKIILCALSSCAIQYIDYTSIKPFKGKKSE